MPTFRTAPSGSLATSIRNMIASGGSKLGPVQEMAVDEAAARTAHNMTLAEKARAEVEAMQAAQAQRADSALRTEYAAHAAGIDLPDATRLSGAIRGQMEQPAPGDIDDAAAVGADAQPYPMARPNLQPGQERVFRSALASTIGNLIATGKTNADELARASGRTNDTALTARAAEAPDVPTANRIVAAVSGKLREPFKTNAQGTVLNEETGALNEGSQLAGLVRKHVASQAADQGAGNKPPSGYAWGPRNAQGQQTLVAIEGGPAAPAATGAAGLTGDAFLSSLPKQKADQIKALAEGRMQFPAGFALKSPYWQDMISSVAQYDPSFDAVNYNSRAKTRAAFVAGREGQSLNALNTVMGHIDDLRKAGEALNNTDYPWINTAANALGGQVSPDLKGRLNAFNISRQAVASEMERAYKGTGGNLADIEAWKKTLDTADSPQAIRAAVKQGVKLLSSKIDALGDQYSKGMGTTKQGLELLNPKTQEIYQRLLGEGAPAKAAALPAVNDKGWKLMRDAKGNQAYVGPNNEIEEVK